MPSGEKWDAYLALITLNGDDAAAVRAAARRAAGRASSALRAALIRLGNDKEFADDAHQDHGLRAGIRRRPRYQRQVRAALTVRPEIRTFVADYIKQRQAK